MTGRLTLQVLHLHKSYIHAPCHTRVRTYTLDTIINDWLDCDVSTPSSTRKAKGTNYHYQSSCVITRRCRTSRENSCASMWPS